jgi:type II secretory pathway pseudopilin PulG
MTGPGAALPICPKHPDENGQVVDQGSLLIELLLVLLIVGILFAIAVPTFITVSKSLGKTAVESNLVSALGAAEASSLQGAGSAGVAPGAAGLVSGSDGGASAGGADTYYGSGNLVVAAMSKTDGRCYAVREPLVGTGAAAISYGYYTGAACSAESALTSVAAAGTGALGAWQTAGFPS